MSAFCTSAARFIPACAGNSPAKSARSRKAPVHPRVCGELERLAAVETKVGGSSPRVRGTHGRCAPRTAGTRFIPACAGNSGHHGIGCGLVAGSSPRVRGTLGCADQAEYRRRFIPACAGNSDSGPGWPGGRPVHPRVCGELAAAALGPHPPLRFIPACAGNSRRSRPPPAPAPVHPRVCGELVAVGGPDGAAGRFIPACAGNSSQLAPSPHPSSVHPRVCGELIASMIRTLSADGSSPRVRGTPPLDESDARPQRFIPACAGNSSPPKR